jgi:FtsH-binding integral membrane protein
VTQAKEDRSERFIRFSHKTMLVLLVMTLALGGVGVNAALFPQSAIANRANLVWVVIAFLAVAWTSMARRLWPADAPEVKLAMQDEWRRANLLRATRIALIVVLLAQLPLALALWLLTDPRLTPPRVAGAMAGATITLGIVTVLILFLSFDRE